MTRPFVYLKKWTTVCENLQQADVLNIFLLQQTNMVTLGDVICTQIICMRLVSLKSVDHLSGHVQDVAVNSFKCPHCGFILLSIRFVP